MVLVTGVAAAYRSLPACSAVTTQFPTASTVTTPVALTVHALFVVAASSTNVTASPEAVVVAVSRCCADPKPNVDAGVNAIVCAAFANVIESDVTEVSPGEPNAIW